MEELKNIITIIIVSYRIVSYRIVSYRIVAGRPLMCLNDSADSGQLDLFQPREFLREMSDPDESGEYVTSENINASNKVSQIFPEMAVEGSVCNSLSN